MSVVVERLSSRLGGRRVLEEIEARALSRRVTIVIGPNAAGKSTLLRCVIGAIRPHDGRVTIDNIDVRAMSATTRASRLAYVPQRSVVSASFSARQVVELGRYALDPSPRRVDEAMELLDVCSVRDQPFPTLSMGQQQRVALARAVAQLGTAGVLVLDEPVSAMDVRHTHVVMRLLRQLADGGATVIIAMHDLTLASSLADDAWVLNEGRLVASGSVADALQPATLEGVFGVRFRWIEAGGCRSVLAPEGWEAPTSQH